MIAHGSVRSTPRKRLKRLNAERSRRGSETGTLTPSDNGSAVNVEGAVVEATGEVAISIGGHHGILDLHLHDVEVRLLDQIIVALHPGVISTLTFPVIAAAVNRMADAGVHPPSEDRSHDLHLIL